jgi:hypothetical protein
MIWLRNVALIVAALLLAISRAFCLERPDTIVNAVREVRAVIPFELTA